MLTISSNTRISLCTSPIDMRKSFNGLLGIVRNILDADPLADHLFVFLNRQHNLMKILYLCLCNGGAHGKNEIDKVFWFQTTDIFQRESFVQAHLSRHQSDLFFVFALVTIPLSD